MECYQLSLNAHMGIVIAHMNQPLNPANIIHTDTETDSQKRSTRLSRIDIQRTECILKTCYDLSVAIVVY